MKSCQLSDRKARTVKKPGYHLDGAGLYLQVTPARIGVTRNWIFRFTSPLTGKVRDMGLGSLHAFSLREARERAKAARQFVADDLDPIEERRKRRDGARAEASERMLFKDAAQRFLALHRAEWKNAKHRQQWQNTLATYAYPTLGSRPVAAIDGALITEALAFIWRKKPETAGRVGQRIKRVCQWVKDGMPLPAQGPSKRVKHHAAMKVDEIPGFMTELRERNNISARALEFTILTVARTSETLLAKWPEIDLDAKVWTVPAERMKAGKEHQVPLSRRAVALLAALPRERGGYVFPGSKARAPLSNMAMLELLRGMDGNGFTVHGFRSSFRDWAGDRTSFARDVIEFALAHRVKDKAEAAYRRSAALEKRRQLMEAWAKYCSSPPVQISGQVVRLHNG
jgi:integrase